MKKIFIILLSIFTFYACSDDNNNDDKKITKQEKEKIFNALLGKWQFSRIAMDADFKDLMRIEEPLSKEDSYILFRADSTYEDAVPYFDRLVTDKFEIRSEMYGDIEYPYIYFNKGACIVPDCEYNGSKLYSYTDTTLIFYQRYDILQQVNNDQFIEFKRIK